MPEGASVGWTQTYVNPNMDTASNPAPSYMMNVIKADQTPRRVMEQSQTPQTQPATNPASVITTTYNPTYNRCLPKILSDLDCEMKIKQVLKCIENILLDGNDLDPQQSYKLPDRSSSPQLVPKKKIKIKEDEDMVIVSPTNSANLGVTKTGINKSPVRINVKVEPAETEKAQRGPAGMANNMFQSDQGAHQVPSASPRQSFEFANRIQSPQPALQQPAHNNYSKPQQTQKAFSFEPYAYPGSSVSPNNAAQFIHQSFLQHGQVAHQQNPQLLMQQQAQHIQAVQQHLQAQQQLLNGMMQQHPQHAQFTLPPVVNHHQQPSSQPNPQTHDGQPVATQSTHENPPFTQQMDEFPFPVFSSTILEEVNQFKSTGGTREEAKKPGEAEDPLFFFGSSPNSNNALLYAMQQHQLAQQTAQQADGTHHQDQIRQSTGLSSSSLLLPPHLLCQMPQLSGLEEDDKWILSLLNIDGVHESNTSANTPNSQQCPPSWVLKQL